MDSRGVHSCIGIDCFFDCSKVRGGVRKVGSLPVEICDLGNVCVGSNDLWNHGVSRHDRLRDKHAGVSW